MERRPEWLRNEAAYSGTWLQREKQQECGFWHRHVGIAEEVDEVCADALLAMLERQLAEAADQKIN
ncbi:MAG: hypothetical protein JO061_06035 [Acidobacteriaceae bacterium]|nr:hypothetical protein [Acidobacteriaceae bacterium]